MKKPTDLIKALKEKSSDWKNSMIRFIDGEIEATDELYNEVFSVLHEIREIYKTSNEIPEDITKELDDPEFVTLISDYIKESLEFYFDLSLLRNLQKEHADIAKKLVSIILEEFIFHTGINGNEKVQKLLNPISMFDETALHETIKALSYFTNYSITNNLNNECIKSSIQIDGTLPEETCTQIADLIWENRIELKMDYIIHRINNNDEEY